MQVEVLRVKGKFCLGKLMQCWVTKWSVRPSWKKLVRLKKQIKVAKEQRLLQVCKGQGGSRVTVGSGRQQLLCHPHIVLHHLFLRPPGRLVSLVGVIIKCCQQRGGIAARRRRVSLAAACFLVDGWPAAQSPALVGISLALHQQASPVCGPLAPYAQRVPLLSRQRGHLAAGLGAQGSSIGHRARGGRPAVAVGCFWR